MLTTFTNEAEDAVAKSEIVPFMLETRLIERGAKIRKAANFQANVVVSERLVTGQNPASATGVAQKMLEQLNSR